MTEKGISTENLERIEGEEQAPVSYIDVDLALAGQKQEELPLKTILASWRKGVTLSLLMGLVIIMRIYDIVLVSSFYGLPSFRDRYGYPVKGDPSAGKQISGSWQVALGVAALVGQVIGAFGVNIPMERYGLRVTLLGCLFLTSCFIFMQFFSPSIQVLTASEYISGVIWGGYQVLIPTYASELMPTQLRPWLTGYIALCYYMGSLICSGILKGFDSDSSEWGYRIPFAIQWIWPIITIPIVFISPESPWWYIKKEKYGKAEEALKKLIVKNSTEIDIRKTVEMMKKTVALERSLEDDTITFRECFRGTARRRTEIVIMVFVCADFCGMFLSPSYYFEQVGLSTSAAYDLNIGVSAAVFVSGVVAIGILIPMFPRRWIFFIGLTSCTAIMLLSGCLACAYQSRAMDWAQGMLFLVCDVIYSGTLGPLSYIFLTEVPSTRLKPKSVSLSIAIDALCGIVTNVANPYLINPGEANLKGKSQFVWGGISVINCIWVYFRLPETKNRTYEEIDILFEREVSVRDFKNYVISSDDLRDDLDFTAKGIQV